MKIDFIREPPLKRVILEIYFSVDFGVTVRQASKIYENIKEVYDIEPNLVLIPPLGESFNFKLGALRYASSDKKRAIEFGKRFITFITTEYTRWANLKDEILNNILDFKEILGLSELDKIFITYQDEFVIKKEAFVLEDNFNIWIQNKSTWDIDYSDFSLGFVPYKDKENNNKIVFRIKSREKSSEEFIFNVDTVFSSRDNPVQVIKEDIEHLLDKGHNLINSHFAELLYETKIQDRIGMKIVK